MAGGHGEGGGKVWTILKVVFILIIIALIIFWLVTGGAYKAWEVGKRFSNPIEMIFGNGTSTGSFIQLPWQTEMTRGPDISGYVGVADEQLQDANAPQQTPSASPQTSARLKEFGSPSPYAGQIILSDRNSGSASNEYVTLAATSDATSPINISGWYLQSAASGVGATIPNAAPVFVGGTVNSVAPVSLSAGSSAIITTGSSPVGVSFRENRCSGYLEETQRFTPSLANTCPSASDSLPQTAANLQTYGSSCFDYIAEIPRCTIPGTIPTSISSACQQFVISAISYNGCVQQHRSSASFALPSWRIYLNQQSSLWSSSHDIIRLLDSEGRVVDVLQY